MNRIVLIAILGMLPLSVSAQSTERFPGQWRVIESPTANSLRGVAVVSGPVIWCSGAEGTVLRSTDGGETFRNCGPRDAKAFDFRDVHAIDERQACVMVAGQGARFYATTDGGNQWKLVYEDPNPNLFFDGMAFWNANDGLAFADPVDGRVPLLITRDGGLTWRELPRTRWPTASDQEHGYAASGTSIAVASDGSVWIGLGGPAADDCGEARVLMSPDRGQHWSASQTPLPGTASAGIFSVLRINAEQAVIVGGDYQQEKKTTGVLAVTTDAGRTWQVPPEHGLRGYRSSVARLHRQPREVLVAVGPTGCDASFDLGQHWLALDLPGFHAIDFAEDGSRGCAVGSEGRIAVWSRD